MYVHAFSLISVSLLILCRGKLQVNKDIVKVVLLQRIDKKY